MKNKSAINIKTVLGVLLGNMLYACAVKFFLLPSNMMSSGTTGIALIINHLAGLEISVFILCFNIFMLVVGYFLIGKAFAMTTIASTFIYPLSLNLLDSVFGEVLITDNMFLNVIFAGMGIGGALGIVIRSGASTGGMDIPPLVLNKYFKIPVSVSLYVFDFIIMSAQVFYHPLEDLLYGILLLIITSVVLDKVLLMGHSKTEVKIVSDKSEAIKNAILTDLDRGVTILHGQGGYSGIQKEVIMSVLSSREAVKVEKLALDIDDDAFIVISKVNEVHGRGFSKDKKYE